MKHLIKNTLRWLNLLLILITLIAYLSPFINPAKVWHFSFLGLAYPLLLLGNVLFILFWLWRKDKYFLFSTGCLLAGFGYFSSFISLNVSSTEQLGKEALSVMTYNVAGLRYYDDGETPEGVLIMKEFEVFVEKYGTPEIMCVQEGSKNNTRRLLQERLDYPYFFKEKGTLILSKYPFIDSGVVPFEETSNSCIWGDMDTPLGTIRVYTAHLQSNWLAPAAMKVARERDPRKKETWEGVAEVMRLYKNAASRRAGQSEMVAAHMSQSPHPVLLYGDLNDPPVSYVYQVLSKNMTDSFCERGFGFDFTYAGKIPALRIDYVLADDQFNILDHQVPKLELSDHYPVFVRLNKK